MSEKRKNVWVDPTIHESVETTQIYLDADLALKEKILAKTTQGAQPPRLFQPGDRLLAFLKGL